MTHSRLLRVLSCILVTSWILAACRSHPAPQTPVALETVIPGETSLPTAVASPTPFKAELVICTIGEPSTIVSSNDPTALAIRAAVLPSAANFGASYIGQAALLASLPSVEDGTLKRNSDGTLSITLKYRDGLAWSDGTPFTAADAILGMNLPLTPFDSPWEIRDIQQIDDLTVDVLVADGAEYPYTPPQPPLPVHILGDSLPTDLTTIDYFRTMNPSLGPYSIAEWVPGSHMLLNANPHYAPVPQVPVVRVRFLADAGQIAAELVSGGCDVALDSGFTLDQYIAIKQNTQLRTSVVPSATYEQITFNTAPEVLSGAIPYFADTRVRQAFAVGIDRGALDQMIVQGIIPVMDSWLPAEHWGHAASLPQYAYDASAASNLLDQAGWTDQEGDGVREYHGSGGTYSCQRGDWSIPEGTPLAPILVTSDSPARQQMAEQIKADLAKIGANIEIQTVPAQSLFSADGQLVHRSFEMALFSAITRPDPTGISRFVGADVFRHPLERTLVHRWQLEDRWLTSEQLVERLAYSNIPTVENGWQGQNYAGWCNEPADLDIIAASEAVNITERQQFLANQQMAVASEVPILPLFARPRAAASAKYVCGIALGPYDGITWNLGTWYFDPTGACKQ